MKAAGNLLVDLLARGFALTATGDGVQVQPASRLTHDLRQAVRANRAGLLQLLDLCELFAERVAIAHHHGGLSWEQAQTLALVDVLSRVTAGSPEETATAVQAVLFEPTEPAGPYKAGM